MDGKRKYIEMFGSFTEPFSWSFLLWLSLQCFDAVGWITGRASGL